MVGIPDGMPRYITRHFPEKRFLPTLSGYVHFGTLVRYRGEEDKYRELVVRIAAEKAAGVGASTIPELLGDPYEGLRKTAHKGTEFFAEKIVSPGDYEMTNLFGWNIAGEAFVEHLIFNDHLACFSVGEFDATRADLIRRGTPHPDAKMAYAVYDTHRLLMAIDEAAEAQQFPRVFPTRLIASRVRYGEKEGSLHEASPGSFIVPEFDDREWAWEVFSKPEIYAHEEEFRVVFLQGNKGTLPDNAPFLGIQHRKIAATIVDAGTY